jgi:hypothetical protein
VATRALFVTVWASLALAAPAFGAPDSTSGGVEVPDARTGGTEGGVRLPQAGEVQTQVQPPGQRTDLSATASRAGAAQAELPPPENGDEDVEVEVPVPPAEPQPSAPAPPPSGTGPASADFASTGLASTGFAVGLYTLLGLGLAAAGLTLLRASAPARLRRGAQRRAAVPARVGRTHRRRHAAGPGRAR